MTSLTISELLCHLYFLSYYSFSLSKLFSWLFLTLAPDFIFLPFGIQSSTTFLVPLYYTWIMLKMSFPSTQPQASLAVEPMPILYLLWKYKQLCLVYLSSFPNTANSQPPLLRSLVSIRLIHHQHWAKRMMGKEARTWKAVCTGKSKKHFANTKWWASMSLWKLSGTLICLLAAYKGKANSKCKNMKSAGSWHAKAKHSFPRCIKSR